MTDNQFENGNEMPTSRTPEPPYRADAPYAPSAQEAFQHPLTQPEGQNASVQAQFSQQGQQPVSTGSAQQGANGVGSPADLPATGSFAPAGNPEQTESFAAARSGDTDSMPRVADAGFAAPAQGSYAAGQQTIGAQGIGVQGVGAQGAGAPSCTAPAPAAASYSQNPASSQQQYYAAAPNQAAAPYRPAAAKQAEASKKPAGAGKTFLFGFLGALVACALAIGGFAIANGGIGRTQTTSAIIGSTDQSVINAVDEGQTLAEAVAAKALPSVVAIYNYQDMSNMYNMGYGYGYGTQGGDSMVAAGMGSGVVISDDGYIITNYHVVDGAAKLTVTVDGKERDAKFIGGDESSDIAVIKVEDTEGLVPADIGDSDDLRIGEWVMTVGAPLGLEQSVATGVVSATNRDTVMTSDSDSSDPYSQLFGYTNAEPEYVYYPNMIQTDAVINPGNSGGALVDADGKLIGINSMLSSQSGNYAGVGFAIPINYAIGIAKDVIDGKTPTHAMLGVSLSQVNSTIAQRYNLSTDTGAYISAITPGTGAADSDLQVGDIITAIDGKKVTSATDVTLDVRYHKVGDTVKVTVNRNGESVDVDVKLTSDESMSKSSDEDEKKQDNSQDNSQGNGGNGRGQGQGNGGYTQEDIERLMEMLGM